MAINKKAEKAEGKAKVREAEHSGKKVAMQAEVGTKTHGKKQERSIEKKKQQHRKKQVKTNQGKGSDKQYAKKERKSMNTAVSSTRKNRIVRAVGT